MIKIQIKSIFWKVLFEYDTIKDTLEGANLRGANLEYADLECVNLRGANLRGANLRGADLRGADLRGANLRGANLRGANLEYADLECANLEYADLEFADLEYADLECADLECAYLRGADLRCANLECAYLECANLEYTDLRGANFRGALNFEKTEWTNQCRRDIIFILQNLKSEVPNLRNAIIKWKIDGTQYEWECACLVWTIGKNNWVDKTCELIPFYKKWLHNFWEQFFYQIHKWDTPENSSFSKIALELCNMVLNKQ